jgi:hypothetical protein
MAHTRSQELDSRINTLEFGFLKTQQEVQQLSATIASRDASINASINASVNVVVQSTMAEVKNELESIFVSLCTKLKIPLDDSFPDAHKKTEGETSSHSFQPHHFQRLIVATPIILFIAALPKKPIATSMLSIISKS